jgi:hypothetical protein
LAGAGIVVVLGLVLWGVRAVQPRSAEEGEVAASELLSGIRMSATVSRSSLGASKALVDFLPENDVRLGSSGSSRTSSWQFGSRPVTPLSFANLSASA